MSQNSKPNNQQERKSRAFRLLCERLLADGLSISAIARQSGKSYKHTKNICSQIEGEKSQ